MFTLEGPAHADPGMDTYGANSGSAYQQNLAGISPGRVAGWLGELLDVDQVLDRQLKLAEKHGSALELTQEEGDDGAPKLVVTVEAVAKGDYTNDWLKNKYMVLIQTLI